MKGPVHTCSNDDKRLDAASLMILEAAERKKREETENKREEAEEKRRGEG
jgi:hypothetical protein